MKKREKKYHYITWLDKHMKKTRKEMDNDFVNVVMAGEPSIVAWDSYQKVKEREDFERKFCSI